MLVGFTIEMPTKRGRLLVASRPLQNYEPHALAGNIAPVESEKQRKEEEEQFVEFADAKQQEAINNSVPGKQLQTLLSQLPSDIQNIEEYSANRQLQVEVPELPETQKEEISRPLKEQYDALLLENVAYADRINKLTQSVKSKVKLFEVGVDPNLAKLLTIIEAKEFDYSAELEKIKESFRPKIEMLELDIKETEQLRLAAEKKDKMNDEKINAGREELRLLEIEFAKCEISVAARQAESAALKEELLHINKYITELLLEKTKLSNVLLEQQRENELLLAQAEALGIDL